MGKTTKLAITIISILVVILIPAGVPAVAVVPIALYIDALFLFRESRPRCYPHPDKDVYVLEGRDQNQCLCPATGKP